METKRGFKKVAFILMIALVVTMIPIMSFGDDYPRTLPSENGVGFHGCCKGGNGDVTKYVHVYEDADGNILDEYSDGEKYLSKGHNGKKGLDLLLTGDRVTGTDEVKWTITEGQGVFKCSNCGNTDWVSFSNEDQEFDGKTVQLGKGSSSQTEEPTPGSIELEKTDSASGDFIDDVEFTLERYNDTTGVWDEVAVESTVAGKIFFGDDWEYGYYRITETGYAEGYIAGTLKFTDGRVVDEDGYHYFRLNENNYSISLNAKNDPILETYVLVKYFANHNAEHAVNDATYPLGEVGVEAGYIKLTMAQAAAYGLENLGIFKCANDPTHFNSYWGLATDTAIADQLPATIDLLGIDPALYITNDKDQEIAAYHIYGHWNEVQGELEPPVLPTVLGEEANPFQQQVLGEEAKTSDTMNPALILFFILAAIAVAGGILAQRKRFGEK